MAQQNQPFTLRMNGSGAQTQTNPNGTPLGPTDRAQGAVIITPQDGPAVPVTPNGTPLDMTVAVLTPYSLVMPPGVIPG